MGMNSQSRLPGLIATIVSLLAGAVFVLALTRDYRGFPYVETLPLAISSPMVFHPSPEAESSMHQIAGQFERIPSNP